MHVDILQASMLSVSQCSSCPSVKPPRKKRIKQKRVLKKKRRKKNIPAVWKNSAKGSKRGQEKRKQTKKKNSDGARC